MTAAQSYDILAATLKNMAVNAIPASMKTDVLNGEVISINPVSLRLHGETDLVIPADLIMLSPLCKEKRISVQTGSALGSHTHSFTGTGSGSGEGTATGPATGTISGLTNDGKSVTGTASVTATLTVHTDVQVSVSGTTSGVNLAHIHTIDILLWRGLQVGDKVTVLRFNQGNSFYVLDRGDL